MGDAGSAIDCNIVRPATAPVRSLSARLSVCTVLALSVYSGAVLAAQPFNNGGSASNGATIYANPSYDCGSCHGSPPTNPGSSQSAGPPGNVPGANVELVLAQAISTNYGGYMGTAFSGVFTTQQLTDLTAYIGNNVPPSASGFTYTTNIPYGASAYQISFVPYLNGTCTDLNSCNAATTYNGSITGAVVSNGSKGTVTATVNAGTGVAYFSYTANAGAFGTDSFTYHVTGPGGSSATQTVHVTIATPAAPTLSGVPTQNIAYSLTPTGVSIPLAGYISGVTNASPLSVNTSPTKGTVSISGETLTYTPVDPNYGNDSIILNVAGPGGTTAGTVPISINVGAPTDNGSTQNIAYNGGFTLDLSTLVSPYFSGATTFAIDQQPTDSTGTLSISGTSVTYTASPTFYGGTDTFKYHATSPGGAAGTSATVTINVATPPRPVASNSSSSVGLQFKWQRASA